MGQGVALNLAQTGHMVILVDITEQILKKASLLIAKNLKVETLFDSELRKADHRNILDRISGTTDYETLEEADFVIDNSTESWSVKELLYPQLDRICNKRCILAANTSAISISRIAATTQRPHRVIGMHFMNPVSRKAVIELVRGKQTSDATVLEAQVLLDQMRKQAILVKDMPGFVSNRVLMLAINEAIFVVQDELATPEDVDAIFVKCLSHRMGPLATADLIGLDTVLRSLEVMYEHYNDPKFQPCNLLRKMVDSGNYGRKTGRGFFDYTVEGCA